MWVNELNAAIGYDGGQSQPPPPPPSQIRPNEASNSPVNASSVPSSPSSTSYPPFHPKNRGKWTPDPYLSDESTKNDIHLHSDDDDGHLNVHQTTFDSSRSENILHRHQATLNDESFSRTRNGEASNQSTPPVGGHRHRSASNPPTAERTPQRQRSSSVPASPLQMAASSPMKDKLKMSSYSTLLAQTALQAHNLSVDSVLSDHGNLSSTKTPPRRQSSPSPQRQLVNHHNTSSSSLVHHYHQDTNAVEDEMVEAVAKITHRKPEDLVIATLTLPPSPPRHPIGQLAHQKSPQSQSQSQSQSSQHKSVKQHGGEGAASRGSSTGRSSLPHTTQTDPFISQLLHDSARGISNFNETTHVNRIVPHTHHFCSKWHLK
jgi:hypothetical protein